MSGPIRTTLGPTLGRIRGYLTTINPLLLAVDQGTATEENMQTLRNALCPN
jgi:hypothetical protein